MLSWQSRPAPPLRVAIVVPAWLSHAVLIPIYWNQAWIVRLPLPISPCANASAPPFGGSGVRLVGDDVGLHPAGWRIMNVTAGRPGVSP